MISDVTIRPCRPDECTSVLALWKDAEAIPSVTDSLDELMRLVRENSDLFLVAEMDARLVGTVIAGWDGWRGNIYRLAVLPNYRRHGIGKDLVSEAEHRLSLKGAKRISVLVAHEEPLAVLFWDALIDAGYNRDLRIIRYVKTL